MFRLLRLYPLSSLCIVIIWALCLLRPSSLPDGPEIPHLDKIMHSMMYLGLCSLLWFEHLRVSPHVRWGHFLPLGVVAPIAMSGIIELAQAFLTDSRSGDWWDFAANTAGVLLAIPLGVCLVRPATLRWFHHKDAQKERS